MIDIELLHFVITHLPDYDFEIAGKIDLNKCEKVMWENLLNLPNVRYLGLIPYNKFPGTVINWNIGLVAAKLDNEYSKYLNNNKQYQYLALGKPFVSLRYNAEYSVFEDLVFIANGRVDYIDKIRLAIKKSVDKNNVEQGRKISSKQSAEMRAIQFLEIVANL